MNETVFCELKLGRRLTSGDVRSPGRDRGTRIHEGVEDAITTLPMPSVKSLEDARALRATGAAVIIPEMYLASATLGVNGIPDLMIRGERLDVFELKSGASTKRTHRRLGTRAFESDAAQVLVYGLLAEEALGAEATLWVVYGAADLLDDIRTTAVARGQAS